MTEREMARRKAAARRARKERERKARNRRVALTICLMVAVCLVSIGGTVAWLQDKTGPVTNTFSPSNIGIDLSETQPTNKTAKMVPGVEIGKDPTVKVTKGSEPCWVFVTVTETNGTYKYKDDNDDVQTGEVAFDALIKYEVITSQDNQEREKPYWTKLDGVVASGTEVYYCEVDALNAAEDITIPVIGYSNGTSFVRNKVLVNNTVDKATMDKLQSAEASNPALSFTAYAIQHSSFSDPAAAWTELSKTNS